MHVLMFKLLLILPVGTKSYRSFYKVAFTLNTKSSLTIPSLLCNKDKGYFFHIKIPFFSLTNRRLSGTQAAYQLRQVQSARTSLHGSMEEIKQLVANQPMSLSDGEGDFMFLSAEVIFAFSLSFCFNFQYLIDFIR